MLKIVTHFILCISLKMTSAEDTTFVAASFFASTDDNGGFLTRYHINTCSQPILVINPRRACAARVTVLGSVCLSVCPCSNSLLDGLFVPQMIRRNKRVIRISLIERFSLKMLHCRDLSVTSIVRVHSAGHFLLAENEHAHYITTTWPSGRERRSCVPRVTISPGYHASKQGLPTMSRLKLKLCKCCQHVFQSKRKAEYSLSDQAMRVSKLSKATKTNVAN